MRMTFKSIFINIACALLAILANSLLKHAFQGRISWKGSVPTLLCDAFSMLQYPLVWLGAAAFLTANILWLLILATQQMSVAYPLQVSLLLVFSTIISVVTFAEKLTVTGITGLVLVLAGIVMLKQGSAT